jgi:predicted enzyme related to lactoylglutathione lyase
MAFTLDYVEFPSADHAASRAFFRDVLGWPLTDYGPDYTALNEAGIDGGIDGGTERSGATMAVVRTDDLDAAEQAVIAGGGIITRGQYDFPGGRRFHFVEPGGNEMAIWIARED